MRNLVKTAFLAATVLFVTALGFGQEDVVLGQGNSGGNTDVELGQAGNNTPLNGTPLAGEPKLEKNQSPKLEFNLPDDGPVPLPTFATHSPKSTEAARSIITRYIQKRTVIYQTEDPIQAKKLISALKRDTRSELSQVERDLYGVKYEMRTKFEAQKVINETQTKVNASVEDRLTKAGYPATSPNPQLVLPSAPGNVIYYVNPTTGVASTTPPVVQNGQPNGNLGQQQGQTNMVQPPTETQQIIDLITRTMITVVALALLALVVLGVIHLIRSHSEGNRGQDLALPALPANGGTYLYTTDTTKPLKGGGTSRQYVRGFVNGGTNVQQDAALMAAAGNGNTPPQGGQQPPI